MFAVTKKEHLMASLLALLSALVHVAQAVLDAFHWSLQLLLLTLMMYLLVAARLFCRTSLLDLELVDQQLLGCVVLLLVLAKTERLLPALLLVLLLGLLPTT